MANTVGRIDLDLGINASGFKRQLNGITKHAKNSTGAMSGMFSKLGKAIGAAFAVKAVVNFAKECINLGSDLAEVQNVVDVTFGHMSAKVNEFAKSAMTSYGLSEKVAKQYMGTFGAMSKAFGYTEEAAYEQAAALTGLAGDVASFYNMTTDEAATKLKSVFTGETETLKELGVVMTQTALDEYALRQGFGKTTKQMSEQEKVALRLKFVTDRLSDASGDFVRTADGWANQTRVLALRFDAIKASIGQGLINVLTPVIRVINEIVAKIQIAAEAFKNFTEALFGNAGGSSSVESFAAASGVMADNMAGTASSAAKIKKSLAGFDKLNVLSSPDADSGSGSASSGGTSVSGPVSSEVTNTNSAADAIKGKLDEIKTKLLELANIGGFTNLWDKFLEGIENCKIGVGNLFTAFRGAISANAPNFEGLKTSVVNTFTTMGQTATTIWGDMWLSLTNGFASFTEENGPAIETFFTNVVGTLTTHATQISTIWGDMFASIKKWWETDGVPIFDGIIQVFKDVGTWALEIYNNYIDPVIDTIQSVLQTLWNEHLKPLWDDILSLVSSVGNVLLMLWNTVLKPLVDWAIDYLGPMFKNVFSNIAKFIGTAIGIVVDYVRYLINSFKNLLNFITGIFTGDWKKAWTAIKDQIANVWNSMWSIIKGIINLIIDALNTLWSMLYNSIRSVVNGLGSVVSGIGKLLGKDWGFSVPKDPPMIPKLAAGGYVAANTPQLAIIGDNKHEGEIVAPESKIAEAVARGFAMVMSKLQTQNSQQNERPLYLTLKLGEDDFWSGFVNYHNSIVKMTGESPLSV